MKKTVLFYYFFVMLLISCKTNEKTEMHPKVGLIPEIKSKEMSISKKKNDKINLTQNLNHLSNLLTSQESNTELKLDRLDLSDNIKVVDIDKKRLIFLDMDEDILVEYNISTKTQTIIANRGRGPGDIFISSDIYFKEGTLTISNKDMRILSFNCDKEPCEYVDLIQLKSIIPLSVTSNGKSFIVLGNNKIPTQKYSESSVPIKKEALWVLDNKGKITNSFGEHYDIQNHWMLQRPFSEGIVEYSEEKELYFLTFERLPYIYVFDQNYEQVKVFKIEEFLIGKQEYDSKEAKLGIVKEGYSIISNMKNLNEETLLIEIKTRKNRRVENQIFVWDTSIDYYVIDLNTFESSFIGNNDSKIDYLVTNELLVIRDTKNYVYVAQ